VALEQRRKQRSHKRFFENLSQRFCSQQRYQLGNKIVVGRRFDDHGEFHGRLFHLDGGFGIGIKSAVNDVGPVHEIGDRSGIEAEALLRDHGDEAGAGFEIGIIKLAVALILLKVLGIGRREEGALVMVEPPGNFGRAGIFEVDNGVFLAIELILVEQSAGAVDQTREFEIGIAANALAIEAGKQRGGGSSVKTLVVIEDPYSQSVPQSIEEFPPFQATLPAWNCVAGKS
jgi:hypothetical protein